MVLQIKLITILINLWILESFWHCGSETNSIREDESPVLQLQSPTKKCHLVWFPPPPGLPSFLSTKDLLKKPGGKSWMEAGWFWQHLAGSPASCHTLRLHCLWWPLYCSKILSSENNHVLFHHRGYTHQRCHSLWLYSPGSHASNMTCLQSFIWCSVLQQKKKSQNLARVANLVIVVSQKKLSLVFPSSGFDRPLNPKHKQMLNSEVLLLQLYPWKDYNDELKMSSCISLIKTEALSKYSNL